MPSPTHEPAVFYAADRNLVIKGVNQDALGVWAKSREEVIGRHLLEVFPFIEGTEIHEAHLEALRTFMPVRLKTTSRYLAGLVDVEIYPVADGVQVRYWQMRTPEGPT